MLDIVVNHLSFSYGGSTELVLDDISMNVNPGDFVCLLGQSGCGKSTLLRLLAGLETPSAGSIMVDGVPIQGAGLQRGVVFQDYGLFPWFSAGRNIMLPLQQKFKGCKKAELKARTLRGLKEVGLDESIYKKYPFELSGGQRQRCAICRAFMLDPPILLMDEPFGALDAITRARLQRMILKLWAKDEPNRKTILFVTHDVDEALILANRILVFGANPGRIIYDYEFQEGEKVDLKNIFEDEHMMALRNTLIQALNRDVVARL